MILLLTVYIDPAWATRHIRLYEAEATDWLTSHKWSLRMVM